MDTKRSNKFLKIQIKKDKFEYFSKGILSLALFSTGMNANLATDIANRVEKTMRESSKEVTKKQPIKMITDEINKIDKNFAERYRVFEGEGSYKPIILLLAGVPGIGKSTLASLLSQRLEITKIIGTDMIREILRQTISPKLVPEIHCSSYEAFKYLKPSLNPILRQSIVGYEEQSRHVIVGVEAAIQSALYSRENTLIEGVHLAPNIINPQLLNNSHVVFILLYLEDEETHLNRLKARGKNVENRGSDRYIDAFEEIRSIQTYLMEESNKVNIQKVETSDRDASLKKIMDIVWEKIIYLEKKEKS